MDFVVLALGLGMLMLGAEWMVKGASQVATSFGIPTVVVGLTLVAWGTSAPELVVSATAALRGGSDLALGNVLGSNLANMGLILGVAALVCPLVVNREVLRRDYPVLLLAQLSLFGLLRDGVLSRLEGLLLIAIAASYTWRLVRTAAPRARATDEAEPKEQKEGSGRRHVLFSLIGIAILLSGGQLMVHAARNIASSFGVSERVIGLTVVAMGTSMPELAASVTAARRGKTELAVGNVIGSNLFNLCIVLGVTAVLRPIEVASEQMASTWVDVVVVAGLTVLMLPLMITGRKVTRWEGGVALTCWAGYMGYLAFG